MLCEVTQHHKTSVDKKTRRKTSFKFLKTWIHHWNWKNIVAWSLKCPACRVQKMEKKRRKAKATRKERRSVHQQSGRPYPEKFIHFLRTEEESDSKKQKVKKNTQHNRNTLNRTTQLPWSVPATQHTTPLVYRPKNHSLIRDRPQIAPENLPDRMSGFF